MGCLSAEAEIIRTEINASMSFTCSVGDDDSLRASDGVLYDCGPEPIYCSTAMGRLTQDTAAIQRILDEAETIAAELATPDTDADVEEVWNNIINS